MPAVHSPREIFQHKEYVIVPNFLEDDIRNYLEFWLYRSWKAGKWTYKDEQSPESLCISGEVPFEILLDYKTNFMSQLVGKKLLPTYSYGRIYGNGSTLQCHVDREECEYSVTICVACSIGFRWDLYLHDTDNNRQYVKLDPGDALVYMGMKRPHGRDTLICNPDQWMMQVFLHYVDTEGPYKARAYDGRTELGY